MHGNLLVPRWTLRLNRPQSNCRSARLMQQASSPTSNDGTSGNALERFFRLRESGTTFRTELVAGITTFLTMAYIIFVQPAVLSGKMFGFETGMDFGSVMVATCLSAALAT